MASVEQVVELADAAAETKDDPAPDGAYGAGETGPSAEECSTNGTRINSAGAIRSSGTFLLEGGSYGSLSVPSGATVKPYNCQNVAVDGSVRLGDGATLAGVTVQSDSDWVIKIGGQDITVRNSTVKGGTIEAIRIYDNARNIKLIGNNLDGGRENHVVKVKAQSSSANPDNILIHNNRFTKTYYGGSSEDLLQLEGHDHVVVSNNTFSDNPRGEDGFDVKQGIDGMLVEHNRFEGNNINAECLLVQGSYAKNIVSDNMFTNCKGVSLGAHPEAKSSPWWRFDGNKLRNSMLRMRRSENAEIVNTEMASGTLKLGITSQDDIPRNLKITGNTFSGVKVENRLKYSYTCANNVMHNMAGESLKCSGTTTSDPGL